MTPVSRSLLLLALSLGAHTLSAQATTAKGDVPAWLYPLAFPQGGAPPDSVTLLRLPHSTRAFTRAQVTDLFAAVDWYPSSHPSLPAIVATGRRPEVHACGYCHLPAGGGRPENAALAGLPADYIVRQVQAFKSGERHSAWTGPHRPFDLMTRVATNASDDEVARAAEYYAGLTLPRRARVVEMNRVPRTYVTGALHAVSPGKQREAIDGRIIEVPENQERFELRDERSGYVAYVPPGSIARGRAMTRRGVGGAAACTTCHGESLRGGAIGPPIAGQFPSYVMRQLVAFRSGARAGSAAMPMQAMTALLSTDDLVALSAYVGSLSPRRH